MARDKEYWKDRRVGDHVVFSLRLPKRLRDPLHVIAEDNNTTVSAIIRRQIELLIREHRPKRTNAAAPGNLFD